jgi:hypothetical protein
MQSIDQSLVDQIYEASVIPERWPQILDQISVYAGAMLDLPRTLDHGRAELPAS